MKDHLLNEFRWRGLLYDQTEGVEEAISTRKVTGYVGFDPTGDSLHVGSLLPIMGLVHLQRYGHSPIALVGGATGMIGDPSGKSKERNLLSEERLAHNVDCIHKQLSRFLDFDCKSNPAKLVNNHDWLGPISFIEFMRDVGKHFPVGYMMAKESVKRRIEGDGISFTEFSYMLLQAYDFYHLSKHHNCELQMGGSDQWGNITAGKELIRRIDGKKAHGVVFPLITTASGQKFGKTEEGAVWLDAEKTSPYKFYQYWMNADDKEALNYLKFFSLLEEEECEELAALQEAAPHKRDVQKRLAMEVTKTVHGATALDHVMKASKAMFGGELTDLSAREIGEIFDNVPSTELKKSDFEGEGYPILDLMANCGVVKSKGEARRLLQGGGVNMNNIRVNEVDRKVVVDDAIEGAFIVLRKGSKNYHLVKVLG